MQLYPRSRVLLALIGLLLPQTALAPYLFWGLQKTHCAGPSGQLHSAQPRNLPRAQAAALVR